jgi:hypothetical protein
MLTQTAAKFCLPVGTFIGRLAMDGDPHQWSNVIITAAKTGPTDPRGIELCSSADSYAVSCNDLLLSFQLQTRYAATVITIRCKINVLSQATSCRVHALRYHAVHLLV